MFSLVRSLRLVALSAIAALTIVVLAGPAAAHDPIFLSADQTTPDTGPYMPDGSISWALYGSVLEAGDTRGFEFDLRDGDELVISLLIPNLSPELELTDDELPVLDLTAPDGTTRAIVPDRREIFDEPFSNTSYVTLYEERGPGEVGRYQGVVTGNAPARFSVAIGINEIFFTETERSGDRPSSFAEISAPLGAWYATPPGADAPEGELAAGEAEIDLDMIDEAMSSGEADAPDGALDAPDDSTTSNDDADELGNAGDETAAEEPAADAEVDEEAMDEPDEPTPADADEAAAAVTDADEGGSLAWVAPVGGLGVAVIGGAVLLRRRSRTD